MEEQKSPVSEVHERNAPHLRTPALLLSTGCAKDSRDWLLLVRVTQFTEGNACQYWQQKNYCIALACFEDVAVASCGSENQTLPSAI